MAAKAGYAREGKAAAVGVLGSALPACGLTLCAAAAIALLLGTPVWWSVGLAALVVTVAAALAAGLAPRFGAADGVTILRLGLAVSLLGLLLLEDTARTSWPLVALLIGLLALDGVDGWIARRRGEASSFGARFDMEADTVMLAVLALLVVATGRGHIIVLASACLRPAFILLGHLVPWLAGPLPPSFRRKLLCILPIMALIAALAPAVDQPLSSALAHGALAMLVVSFAIDVRWLARNRARHCNR